MIKICLWIGTLSISSCYLNVSTVVMFIKNACNVSFYYFSVMIFLFTTLFLYHCITENRICSNYLRHTLYYILKKVTVKGKLLLLLFCLCICHYVMLFIVLYRSVTNICRVTTALVLYVFSEISKLKNLDVVITCVCSVVSSYWNQLLQKPVKNEKNTSYIRN